MRKNSRTIAEISIFSALIIVLQIIATYINIGSFPITLTLIPIIVAGCVYGEKVGALMGFVFGGIVSIMVITGADPSGATMLVYNPIATISACMVKGVLCGFVSSYIYKVVSKKDEKLAVVLASISCPIVNTGVFSIFLLLFFDSTIKSLIGLFLSFNFVLELALNILIAPKLTNLIKHNKERFNN